MASRPRDGRGDLSGSVTGRDRQGGGRRSQSQSRGGAGAIPLDSEPEREGRDLRSNGRRGRSSGRASRREYESESESASLSHREDANAAGFDDEALL